MTWEALIAVVTVLLVATVVSAQVVNPLVTTDKSVDTSSLQSLVRDVCVGKETKQDKALLLLEESETELKKASELKDTCHDLLDDLEVEGLDRER